MQTRGGGIQSSVEGAHLRVGRAERPLGLRLLRPEVLQQRALCPVPHLLVPLQVVHDHLRVCVCVTPQHAPALSMHAHTHILPFSVRG
eukprot:258623-Rhodomonas_salina.1